MGSVPSEYDREGSVPSEYYREGAVPLDVQIGSEQTYMAPVSASVCLLYFKLWGRNLLSLVSYVPVSKIQVIDTNLAATRLGLAQEEEVESMKRLVKALPSVALFNCASAPSGIGCVHVPCWSRSYASKHLGPLQRMGVEVVAFQVCLNADKYLTRLLIQRQRKLPYDLCLIV